MYCVVSKTMELGEMLLLSLLGMAVVFVGLIMIMVMIRIVRVIVDKVILRRKPAEAIATPATAAVPAGGGKVSYDGSLGEVALHSVEDKTAALLMAIVADQLKTPLNELRFISIREVNAT